MKYIDLKEYYLNNGNFYNLMYNDIGVLVYQDTTSEIIPINQISGKYILCIKKYNFFDGLVYFKLDGVHKQINNIEKNNNSLLNKTKFLYLICRIFILDGYIITSSSYIYDGNKYNILYYGYFDNLYIGRLIFSNISSGMLYIRRIE